MKIHFILVCTLCILVKLANCASVHRPQMVTVADFARLDQRELDFLEDLVRTKRSTDLLSGLKSKIGDEIKSKLGLLSQYKAQAKSPHYGHPSGHGYGLDDHYSKMSFDFWTLKKSIFNTLLQAAKAIKGGIIAIKGQLIKGSGSLISAKGNFIKNKGEALSSIGKNIASSAILAHPGHAAHASGPVIEYDVPSSHGYDGYASHSAPGVEYGHHVSKPHPAYLPHKYHSYDAGHKIPHGGHAGILVLKKAPPTYAHEIHHHEIHHEKPVIVHPTKAEVGSSLKGLIGKFLAATAKASAAASAHASSYVAHKTASAVSHLGKAAAVGAAAASAHLSSSKEPDEHYSQAGGHFSSSGEGYEYDNSGAYNEPSAKYQEYSDESSADDNAQEGTENQNVYPTKADHLLATLAALRATTKDSQKYDQPTDSYGKPLQDQSASVFKQSVTGNNPVSFQEMNLDTLNMYSGMNEHFGQYESKISDTNTNSNAPTLHLSLSQPHQTSLEHTKPHLYFGVNLPLESSDVSDHNNNYHSFSNVGLDYNQNDASNSKHIEFDANSSELHKLLGPSSLVEPPRTKKGLSPFLPTPATYYDRPHYTSADNSYLGSLRSIKRKRSPRRRKSRQSLKTVGYEIGPNGRPIKL